MRFELRSFLDQLVWPDNTVVYSLLFLTEVKIACASPGGIRGFKLQPCDSKHQTHVKDRKKHVANNLHV